MSASPRCLEPVELILSTRTCIASLLTSGQSLTLRPHNASTSQRPRQASVSRRRTHCSIVHPTSDLTRTMVDYNPGASVTGTLATGGKFQGEIFAYDASTSMLAVRTPGEISNSYDLKLINVADAKDVKVDTSKVNAIGKLPDIDDPRRERRFANALKHARVAADNIGENVSALAQDVFDALARTLPCRWDADVIVVMDEVKVSGPTYAAAKGCGSTPGAEERVQKVLEHERAKLGI